MAQTPRETGAEEDDCYVFIAFSATYKHGKIVALKYIYYEFYWWVSKATTSPLPESFHFDEASDCLPNQNPKMIVHMAIKMISYTVKTTYTLNLNKYILSMFISSLICTYISSSFCASFINWTETTSRLYLSFTQAQSGIWSLWPRSCSFSQIWQLKSFPFYSVP